MVHGTVKLAIPSYEFSWLWIHNLIDNQIVSPTHNQWIQFTKFDWGITICIHLLFKFSVVFFFFLMALILVLFWAKGSLQWISVNGFYEYRCVCVCVFVIFFNNLWRVWAKQNNIFSIYFLFWHCDAASRVYVHFQNNNKKKTWRISNGFCIGKVFI